MKILRIETTKGEQHGIPVMNKRHAAKVLLNLQRLGILCKKWWYREVTD